MYCFWVESVFLVSFRMTTFLNPLGFATHFHNSTAEWFSPSNKSVIRAAYQGCKMNMKKRSSHLMTSLYSVIALVSVESEQHPWELWSVYKSNWLLIVENFIQPLQFRLDSPLSKDCCFMRWKNPEEFENYTLEFHRTNIFYFVTMFHSRLKVNDSTNTLTTLLNWKATEFALIIILLNHSNYLETALPQILIKLFQATANAQLIE